MEVSIINELSELVPVEKLKKHPRNPRRGNVEAIRESMRENGFYGYVAAQRSTGYIVVGNHRFEAAVSLGMESVPVVWLDVDDDRAMKILLADNKTNDMAGYDEQELLDILGEMASLADSLKGTGWTESELGFMRDTKTCRLDKSEEVASEIVCSETDDGVVDSFIDKDELEEKDDVASSVESHVSSEISVLDVPEKIFTPKLDPAIADKEYCVEDVLKKKEELDSAFSKPKSKLLTLTCPACGNDFFIDKEGIK